MSNHHSEYVSKVSDDYQLPKNIESKMVKIFRAKHEKHHLLPH